MPVPLNPALRASTLAALLIVAPALGALRGATVRQDARPQNPDAQILADFLARVKQYAELHDKLERTIGPPPTNTTPEKIEQHQHALERLIAQARAGAKRGDIFTDPIRAYFRRQLSRVFLGPDGRAIRDSIVDEDTRAIRLIINARYPDTLPRSTVPTQVLLVLPRLPEELEYRFVGTQLVLLDVHSATVVDFMGNAIPR